MLRVGLTGDLGSGKSTVAGMLARRGAFVFSSDEMGRRMMQPGEAVYAAILQRFGSSVLAPGGTLDRPALAKLAFTDGRVEELNAIVHPAVLREQARELDELVSVKPHAVAVVESALIFTTRHGTEGQPWRKRFDQIVLVRAPEADKVARFVSRLSAGRTLNPLETAAVEDDARARLHLQTSRNETHAGECLVIENSGDLAALERAVEDVWQTLLQAEAAAG